MPAFVVRTVSTCVRRHAELATAYGPRGFVVVGGRATVVGGAVDGGAAVGGAAVGGAVVGGAVDGGAVDAGAATGGSVSVTVGVGAGEGATTGSLVGFGRGVGVAGTVGGVVAAGTAATARTVFGTSGSGAGVSGDGVRVVGMSGAGVLGAVLDGVCGRGRANSRADLVEGAVAVGPPLSLSRRRATGATVLLANVVFGGAVCSVIDGVDPHDAMTKQLKPTHADCTMAFIGLLRAWSWWTSPRRRSTRRCC